MHSEKFGYDYEFTMYESREAMAKSDKENGHCGKNRRDAHGVYQTRGVFVRKKLHSDP